MQNAETSLAGIQKINVFAILLLLLFCSCGLKKQNQLSDASSPYLKEHADNPVNWYEWGDEALQLAKKENKPLLISIGYAACHWCHEMERESFMDTGVARVMNENFVCIKVDREERPDIDNIYSDACQLISGSSGWPLNAFALPDGKPFFAGTYYSRAGWMSLLKQIATAYTSQNNKVVLQAQALSNGIANLEFSVLDKSPENGLDKITYQNVFDSLYRKMDLTYGGLKGTPKFPAPSSIEFLLQYYFLTKDKRALEAATTTLTRMALGGIYDQIGGGFSRYAIDSLWHIPHFEKMLYDNAQLLSVYAHAYQLTGDVFFKGIVREIAGFIQNDLANADGGYYSSLNAETKDGEGEFYSWRSGELQKSLQQHYTSVADYYNVSEDGNWKESKNILFASETPVRYAQKNNLQPEIFSRQLVLAKQALLTERSKREKPSVDGKILTSWNALLLKGWLDAYAALGDNNYLQHALSIARFLEKNMIQKTGKLWRCSKDGKVSVDAFLDDYSLLAKAYIRLYQLTFDKHWLVLARQLADYAIQNFYDGRSGMFFYSSGQSGGTAIRKINITDNSIPSSNAAMAEVLYTLSVCFENKDYLYKSRDMLSKLQGQLRDGATNFYTSWSYLLGLFAYGTNEVAIVGKEAVRKNIELQKRYLPVSIFIGSATEENLPLLEGKKSEHTLIYVCKNRTCKRPVEETSAALAQLIN